MIRRCWSGSVGGWIVPAYSFNPRGERNYERTATMPRRTTTTTAVVVDDDVRGGIVSIISRSARRRPDISYVVPTPRAPTSPPSPRLPPHLPHLPLLPHTPIRHIVRSPRLGVRYRVSIVIDDHALGDDVKRASRRGIGGGVEGGGGNGGEERRNDASRT